MLSNSKLNSAQKSARKDMLKALSDGSSLANNGVTTFLCIPRGSVTEVFSSVMSADEKEFRAKVGEFHALNRYFKGQAGLILSGCWDAEELAEMFAL